MAITMAGANQETLEVNPQHKFDEASLAEYLRRELPGFEGSLSVRKFGFGQSNPTYLLATSAGQKYVLRKRPPGKLIKGAHAVDREHRVMSSLGRAGFEVPEVFVLCEDESVIGTAFYVMRFVKGPIVDNGLLQAEPESRRGIMFSIVKTLAKLHRYSPADLGLMSGKPYGKVGGFYERQMATMERTSQTQVSNSDGKVPPIQKMPELLQLFRANMPEDISCLIHGDWKPDNMILSEGPNPEVVAVIDWEMSTIGHPMSDVANLCLPYHMPKGNIVGYPVFDMSSGSGIPSESEVHKVYCEAAGVTYPIAGWSFYLAFACFRLSVISQGIAMRAARGQASAGGSVSPEQMVKGCVAGSEYMCNMAYEIMRKASPEASKL